MARTQNSPLVSQKLLWFYVSICSLVITLNEAGSRACSDPRACPLKSTEMKIKIKSLPINNWPLQLRRSLLVLLLASFLSHWALDLYPSSFAFSSSSCCWTEAAVACTFISVAACNLITQCEINIYVLGPGHNMCTIDVEWPEEESSFVHRTTACAIKSPQPIRRIYECP